MKQKLPRIDFETTRSLKRSVKAKLRKTGETMKRVGTALFERWLKNG